MTKEKPMLAQNTAECKALGLEKEQPKGCETLSDKIQDSPLAPDYKDIAVIEVKEFIKKLKEEIDGCEYNEVHIAIIDKLAGGKLV